MGDRYRYPRPRSPVYNPARASLPINISGWASHEHYDHYDHHDHHLHAVPSSRREVIPVPGPRSSGSNISSNPGTVTKYKIMADPPSRTSSTRDGSRTRRSTLDSNVRPPAIVTENNRSRHRPVIHSAGVRPASPLKNPYRSSEEEYYALPASSKHGHQHRKRYSATMDNADMNRLARERDGNRLRVGGGREGVVYTGTRARQGPIYPSSAVRHGDSVADDYGADGYGYTGPRDLVQYDLNNNTPRHHMRSNSIESGRIARPSNITPYNDVAPRPYDGRERERGPPPSTRGFDRIPARVSTWDQPPQARMPVAPMDPISRPAPFDPIEPVRRTSSARPQSMYHDNRDPRRAGRDDYYEVRDDERHRQPHRQDTYDDEVEQRGFGIRADRPEKVERSGRSERSVRSERSDRPDRVEWPERSSRSDRPERYDKDYPDDDRSDHKGRDTLAAGLGLGSIAGAALGLNAAKNAKGDGDDRDDRDDRRRREYDDEPRRRRDRDDREVDLGGRDPKERRHRDHERDNPPRDIPQPRDSRDMPPPPRDIPSTRDPRDIPPPPRDVPTYGAPEAAFLDISGRDPKERPSSRDGRDVDPDRRERRRHHSEVNGPAIDSHSDTSSEDAAPRARRESRHRRDSGTQPAGFNPKDPLDLKALKDALNAKDAVAPPKLPPKEPLSGSRTPRGSMTKDPREVADIRSGLDDRRSRDPLQPADNRQLRVVSPPREKLDNKPVKGILRQPRPAFPEDPSPIREGVAPLKDAKKDGVPPDARWTKISRKLVNPEALEAGKERFEAREDFVIVLRVLSRDEVQGYAEVTERIRASREQDEEVERAERRRARRERHERHKRERNGEIPRSERSERRHRRHRSDRVPERESSSESDTTDDGDDDDRVRDAPRMLEGPKKRTTFEDAVMSGGLGDTPVVQSSGVGGLRENPDAQGTYTGYTRNPPPPSTSIASQTGTSSRR